jgi:O-antigen/teichoic acid export membrane protein
MFMHKIGSLLVNTVDSVVIAAFVGVVALGSYSNYSTIEVSMSAIVKLVFTSLASVLGHLYVSNSKKTVQKYCEAFQLLNFGLGVVFFLGYYAVADHVVALLFAEELVAAKTVSAVVTLNGFVQFMRCGILVFRDATGTFYYDRWKPLAEGVINLVLSVILIRYIGVVGVITATVLTSMAICHVVEPYVLYRHAFFTSPVRFYLQDYGMILAFAAALALYDRCSRSGYGHWGNLLINGTISVSVSVLFCMLAMFLNRGKITALKKDSEKVC